ncbi:MAG: nucleotidyltransferase family protein [Candidatus Promineifilaceae bacterium]
MSQPFTEEESLLLQCLRSLVQGVPFTKTVENVNWEAAYKLANKHNLVPFLEMALPNSSVPEKIAALITKESRRRKMRAAVMIQDFKTIHQALVENGIRVMPIKGIALTHTIYPIVSLRYFDDIDLLVPAQDAPQAEETLKQIGYIIHPRAPKPDWHHLPPYIHHQHNTMIEIHTDLIRRTRPGWNVEGIWDRARQAKIDGMETWLMSNEDALIYTALHARHNLYNRLSYFLDATLLALKIPSDEGGRKRLVVQAREAGGTAALAHILATGSRLFGVETLPLIPRSRTQRWLANKIGGWQTTLQSTSTSLEKGPLGKLMELPLMDSMGDSLHLAGRLIAPPPEFVSQGYGDGDNKKAGYGKRLFQRLTLAAGQLVKVVRNR